MRREANEDKMKPLRTNSRTAAETARAHSQKKVLSSASKQTPESDRATRGIVKLV